MNKRDLAATIESVLDIEQVVEESGVKLKRGFGVCPFHTEDTASFHVANGFGYCFGCGWHGGVIKYEQDFYNLSYEGAINRLNNVFSLGLPIGRAATISERAAFARARDRHLAQARERQKREMDYERLSAEWVRAMRDSRGLRPASPDDPFDDRWVEAIKSVDYLSYQIDCLQEVMLNGRGDEHEQSPNPKGVGRV